jgi:hypothetical protein
VVLLRHAHAVSTNIGRSPPRAVVAAEASPPPPPPPPPFDNVDVVLGVTQTNTRARTHTQTDDPPTADRRRPPTCSCSIFIIIIIIIFHSAAVAVYAGPTDTAPGAHTHLLLGHPRVRRRRGRTVVVSRCIQRRPVTTTRVRISADGFSAANTPPRWAHAV